MKKTTDKGYVFNHAGHEIHVDGRGEFFTTLNKQRETAPTLSALKKRIDASLKVPFTPFKAMQQLSHITASDCKKYHCDKNGLAVVTVVSIQRLMRNHWNGRKYGFVFEQHNGVVKIENELLVDTPANREAIRKAKVYQRETNAIEQRREKEQERLDGLIQKHDADNFKMVKPS